jgi:hypothetical protein
VVVVGAGIAGVAVPMLRRERAFKTARRHPSTARGRAESASPRR